MGRASADDEDGRRGSVGLTCSLDLQIRSLHSRSVTTEHGPLPGPEREADRLRHSFLGDPDSATPQTRYATFPNLFLKCHSSAASLGRSPASPGTTTSLCPSHG